MVQYNHDQEARLLAILVMQKTIEKKPLIVPPVYLLVFILGQVAINRFWPLAQLIEGPIRYAGLVLLAVPAGFVVLPRQMATQYISLLFKR